MQQWKIFFVFSDTKIIWHDSYSNDDDMQIIIREHDPCISKRLVRACRLFLKWPFFSLPIGRVLTTMICQLELDTVSKLNMSAYFDIPSYISEDRGSLAMTFGEDNSSGTISVVKPEADQSAMRAWCSIETWKRLDIQLNMSCRFV